MTPSSTFLTGEADHRLEHETLTFSHRRRWSTPVDSESRGQRGVCGEFVSCSSSDNSHSFYLDGKMSPWGALGPPLLTDLTSSALRGEERRGRSVTRKTRDLPPYLTTLDCNGRPRFNHRRVRSEGRLEICSVAVELPEIVSVRGREGLRIGTVRISQQEEEDEEEQLNC